MPWRRRQSVLGIAALALASLAGGAAADPLPEQPPEPLAEPISLGDPWPSLQELLQLPDWLELELSMTAEPLFNPLGGERSAGSWIQQGTLSLNLSSGLNKASSSWREWDHWQLSVDVNHDAGDAYYNNAIGALFPLQQVAYPAGFYLSEIAIQRQHGEGWLNVKAGILPINPDFVEVPVLGNYVHSAFNNTLNITVAGLPINPYTAFGGVVTAHASPELSLRYGLFDLSSTDTLSRWLGLSDGGIGPNSGVAQFLQLDLQPSAMSAQPLPACRTERGVVRWSQQRGVCPAPVSVENQLPDGLFSVGGFLTSENGNGVYGSITVPSGLPLGLAHRFWLGGSYAPDASQPPAPTYVGGGLVVQGMLPGRPLDIALLGLGRGGLSNQLSSSTYEGMLELGYRIQINQTLNLQPTLQWIFNPSGTQQPLPGILAAGMQIQVTF
ncbi:MAG: carbohydrate porin [Cyanobacteria bacterium K_DeepCast_150m_m2_101]|nr:carbohydrate porin [Cyanobacteria bacterium K_DeepCast_150m_m2_101]